MDLDAAWLLAEIVDELRANTATRQRLTVRARILTECATRLRTGEAAGLVRGRLHLREAVETGP